LPLKALLVEDNAFVALLVEDEIRAAGFEVRQANSGHAALSLIGTLPHLDAAVLNLNLGLGPGGKLLVRALRDRWTDLPIVVLTGYGAHAPEADLRGLGGPMARLHKPVEMDELRSLLISLGTGEWTGRNRSERTRMADKKDAEKPAG
jgi:DNA-binding response OmpR family regulator